MDDLLDAIISDGTPSEISDKIKDALFAKSAERIDALKPSVANAMFDLQGETEDE